MSVSKLAKLMAFVIERTNDHNYGGKKSWINGPIFQWEMSRLSTFLKLKTPNTKYGLLLDNVPSHVSVKFPNLKLIFQPLNTTSRRIEPRRKNSELDRVF